MAALTLTFDNGPHPDATPLVLDELAAREVRSTFFVIGERLAVPGARALAERARAEGHWIGNHTFTHSVPLGVLPETEARAEIDRTQALLGDLAHPRKLFRPYGAGGHLDRRLLSAPVVAHLEAESFTCVLWNAIPGDWKNPDGWVETALAQASADAHVLMVLHDLPTGAMRHLGRFLDQVADRGIELRQDFPRDCVAIENGVVRASLGHLLAA